MIQQTQAANYSLHDKWGEALNEGFVVIPSALIRYQHKLKISDGELVVLMNLFMSWRKIDEYPFPQTSTLAKRMDVNARTVQRHIERLEEKGFIRRFWNSERRGDVRAITQYDLSGIVNKLKQMGSIEQRPQNATHFTNSISNGAA